MDTPSLPPVMVPKSQTSAVSMSLGNSVSGSGALPLEVTTGYSGNNQCLTNLNANTNNNLNNINLITPPTSGYVTDDSNGNGSPQSQGKRFKWDFLVIYRG